MFKSLRAFLAINGFSEPPEPKQSLPVPFKSTIKIYFAVFNVQRQQHFHHFETSPSTVVLSIRVMSPQPLRPPLEQDSFWIISIIRD